MSELGLEAGDFAGELERALEEHKECTRRLSELESCLEGRAGMDAAALEELRDRLAALSETFRVHCASEKEGPLFREFPASFPQFAQRLEKLACEPHFLLAEAADLQARIEALQDVHARQIRSIEARTRLLLARLRRHEAEEDEILLSAYWDDAGSGD